MPEIAVKQQVTETVHLSSLQTAGPQADWLLAGRIPGLDGLRGLAILMVCLFHAGWSEGWPRDRVLLHLTHVGDHGVDLFFAISGFLITLLLVRSLHNTGSIRLLGFYQRRCLRILPAYGVYLLVLWGLQLRGIIHPLPADWFGVLTYTTNFQENPPWVFGHIWSLSQEEQFYLIWPLALLFIRPQRSLKLVLALLLLLPAVRLGIWLFNWNLFFNMGGRHLVNRLDAMLLGCALGLAVFYPRLYRSLALSRWQANLVTVLALGVLWTSIPSAWVAHYPCILGRTFDAVAVVALLWVAVSQTGSLFERLINSRLLGGLGVISYSLYLWQQMFLFPAPAPAAYMRWPVNLLCALGCALASYLLVERPFLRLKDGWERRN